MRPCRILIPAALFILLACSAIPSEVAIARPTLSPAAAASLTPITTDEPSTPPTQTKEDDTSLLPATILPATASPQPAIARHHPGDPLTLDRIVMVDASNGWAISGGDVLFTADAAQTWREATPPQVSIPGSQVHAQGAFLDARYAWIIFSPDDQILTDAVVWYTRDGGYTWTPSAPIEHEVFGQLMWAEFAAPNETHIWLILRGLYVGAGNHNVAQLFRSTDGGLTWLPLTGSGNHDYTGMIFMDSKNGLVTWQTTGAYAPAPPEYALTSDGGLNWEMRELPPPADEPDLFDAFYYCESFQPRMLSDRSLRILMGCFGSLEEPQTFSSYLYASEDRGTTWTSIRLPEKVQAEQATLFFFDNNALLLGRDIYRSSDGGQSWEYVRSVYWDGQFTFVDPQTGWAIARAGRETALVKTTNGGMSWGEIKPAIVP